MTFYEPLLSIHILAAITWIGGATTMQFLAIRARGSATPAEMASVAGQAAWLGKRVLTPAAGIVLLAGILMVLISWSFEQLWIIFGLVAFAGSLLSGIFFSGPSRNAWRSCWTNEIPPTRRCKLASSASSCSRGSSSSS